MTQTYPLIISVPHAYGQIPKRIQARIALTDYEIWQMHDPFTTETCFHPNAFAIHKAKNHRILGDLNRDKNADIFRETDFYNRKIWKKGKSLSKKEKTELLKKYWDSFRENISKSFKSLIGNGAKKILFIDHHNTATDHPANRKQYLPPILLGNFGESESGEKEEKRLSASPKVMQSFQSLLNDQFPSISVEINKVYRGGSIVRFIRDKIQPEFPKCKIHAMLLEYDLNLIFNPLSKKTDNTAKKQLHQGINTAIELLIKQYFL